MLEHRFYNPSLMSDSELRQAFVVRGRQLKQLLQLLESQPKTGSLHHVLIIGPRGAGKTTLGLRLMLEVRENPKLNACWQPVIFFEESYGITDLAGLWLAALKHLSDATKDPQWTKRVESLLKQEASNKRLEASALAGLVDFSNETNKRLILFVENLDQIFSQFLDRDEFHRFRAVLQERSEILVVGTASSVFEEVSRRDQPFYEFFQLIRLPALTQKETADYISSMLTHAPTASLSQALRNEPARLDTIRRFTGGNPRLIGLAARMISESPTGGARDDLERLIDEQTPYFKARIEQLAAQSRAIFHVLAEGWRPMLAREVAAVARLSTSQASAQLKKLHTLGYVEIIAGTDKKVRYQVLERFYNIYCLLRFTRGQKERLSRLIEFITQVFGLQAAAGMAEATLIRLKGAPLRDDWAAMAALTPYLKEPLAQPREILREVVDISNAREAALPDDLLSAAWDSAFGDEPALNGCVIASRRYLEEHPKDFAERAKLALGLAQLRLAEEATKEVEMLLTQVHETGMAAAQDVVINVAASIPAISSAAVDAEVSQREIVKRFPTNSRAKEALSRTLRRLNKHQEAVEVLEAIDEENRSARTWGLLARSLNSLKRYDEAGSAAERAIALDANNAGALFALGVSKYYQKDYVASERLLTASSLIDADFDTVWLVLADAKKRLGKSEEAEAILYDRAKLHPSGKNWDFVGDFYYNEKRYEEAIVAYKKGIEADPSSSELHFDLAFARQAVEGEAAARESLQTAIELDPKNVGAYLALGIASEDENAALEFIRKAVEHASSSEHLALAAMVMATECNEIEESLTIAERALASGQKSSLVFAMTSNVFAKAGKWNEALLSVRSFVCSKFEAPVPLPITETLIEAVAAGHGDQVLDILEQKELGALLEPLLHAVREELGKTLEPLPAEIASAVREMRQKIAAFRN